MKERQLDLNSRSMREDTIRLQRIREEEYKQKKARRSSRIRILIAMIASAALVRRRLCSMSVPLLRLLAGKRALETGNPPVRAGFQILGDPTERRMK